MESLYPTRPEMTESSSSSLKPAYEPPKITVMNEDEILSAFQITLAGVTWWNM